MGAKLGEFGDNKELDPCRVYTWSLQQMLNVVFKKLQLNLNLNFGKQCKC